MAEAAQPTQVGRYQISKLLGKGRQGAVYLARDPQLQRPVALKTVNVERQSAVATAALLDEVRTISQVQHPNIVTLYDVLEQDSQIYLVFEYVEGGLLSALLEKGRLVPARAVEIALQVLDGLAHAHAKEITHCDIKPANIMLDGQNVARIMDFGIARQVEGKERAATLAEEANVGAAQAKAADVFAIGLMLYQMLTGRAAASGDNIFQVMHVAAAASFPPPSAFNKEVAEALDSIVMRALLKDPEERFLSAGQMRLALLRYAQPAAAEGDEEVGQSTLDFLLRRIRLKSDFPALSQAICAINKITDADTENLHNLTDIILKDFSLTNKLLRLANSASYGQYGGTISTISSAVIVLGFDTVRNLAVTLILFEHLQNKGQAVQLRDEVIRTFFNGLVARLVEKKIGSRNSETSFIAAMFHNLGRLLAIFYLYEEAMEIRRRMQVNQLSEELAEQAVLGLTYAELGMGIARAWNFPDKLVDSMLPPSSEHVRAPQGEVERLRVVAGLSHALMRIATYSPMEQKGKLLGKLSRRFSAAVPLNGAELSRLVDDTVKEFLKEAAMFGINSSQSEALRNARQWVGLPVGGEGNSANEPADTLDQHIQQTAEMAAEASAQQNDAKAVLLTGVQDITNLLVGNYQLNELLRVILETMYRGLGFDRVLLCMRDLKTNSLPARIGFGNGVDDLIKRFAVPLAKSQDVFQVALDKQADIFLSDINAENIRDRVPKWYRNTVSAETFILLPVVIDKRIIGLFYGDKSQAGQLAIPSQELNLLKTLRNQAVLAIRQKQLGL